MGEQIFSDGIGSIAITGGTVRVDLVTISPTDKDVNGQPKAVFQQRIVMTIDGFTHAAAKIQEAMQAIARLSGQASGIASVGEPVAQHAEAPASPLPKPAKPPFP